MTLFKRIFLGLLAVAGSAWSAQAQETTIRIGLVKSISNVANLWAVEKGYRREVGKMRETDGLTIADVDMKVLPFTQMAIAMSNKAIDAAIVIPPFTSQFLDQGHAVAFKDPDDLVKPHPLTIAVSMINTDWAKANDRIVRNYYQAYLRAVRDYCNAYHGGKDRKAMIDLLIKTGTENRPQLLHDYPWPARNPNGIINTDSMLDM